MVQTGIENEPVAVRSVGDGKAPADPAVCLCVLEGGHTYQYLLSVLSDWILFFRQKAVFWNLVMRSGSYFDGNYRGPLNDFLFYCHHGNSQLTKCHRSPKTRKWLMVCHFMGCSMHDNGVTFLQAY